MRSQRLPINVIEQENAYLVEIEIPGLEQDDVELLLNHDSLEIKININDEELNYIHRERIPGEYSRKLRFSKPIDTTNAKSEFGNGVLSVTLPVAPEAKVVRLSIN